MNASRIAQYIAATSLAALVGCPGTPDFIECRDGESCFEGGQCLANLETGHQFCAYEDPSCPSGMRWSDLDVEDGISGECVDETIPLDGGLDGTPQDATPVDADANPGPVVPVGMVDVTAGNFSMGCNVVAGCGPYADMLPYHVVTLSRFAIDRAETSVAEYYACLDAGVCTVVPTGITDRTSMLPVRVTWQGASTYCAWRGRRMPTEAEWEKAARSYDGRQYPWGDVPPTCELVNFTDCSPDELHAVNSHAVGASVYGAINMAGNMWEWVADYYAADYYATSPATDPQGPATGTNRVNRGGDYLDGATHIRTWYRRSFAPTVGAGVRCAISL